ncbi:MAG: tetratricopeptide repeat protein [Phycisphaerales bacterium]
MTTPDANQLDNPHPAATRKRKLLALIPLLLIVVGSAYALYRATSSPAVSKLASSPTDPAQGPPRDELLDTARQALRNNKFDLAAQELAAGVERFPNDQPLRLAFGEALMALEKFPEAYEQYDHAVALGPDRPEYRFAAGMAAAKAGLDDHAEAQWIKARELDKANPQYPLFLAQLQRKNNRPGDARANLVIAATLDPNLAVAWGSLAALALDENHIGPALQHIEKAVKLDPTNPVWRLLQSKVLRRDNRPREALAVMSALPKGDLLTNLAAIDELASCHAMLGDPRAAADAYIRAAEGSPENAEFAYQAALWLEKAGDTDRAHAYAKRAGMLGKAEGKKLAESLDAAR